MMWTGAVAAAALLRRPGGRGARRARGARRDRRLDARQDRRRGPRTRPRFLERLYPNRFADLAVGRVRYGVLTTDGGRIMDDGTVARLGDDLFYVTTTSTGSESVVRVVRVVERGLGLRRRDRQRHRRARGDQPRRAARARGARGAHRTPTSRTRRSATSTRREIEVAGVPCLALRIGFVGELGYELHCAGERRPSTSGTRSSPRGARAVRARAAAGAPPREGRM